MSHLRELSCGKTSLAREATGGREGGVNCLEGTAALSKSETVAFWRVSVLRAFGAVGRAGGWRWREGSCPTTARRATLRKLEDEMYLAASSSVSASDVIGRPKIRFCVSTGKSPNGILGISEHENSNSSGHMVRELLLWFWSTHIPLMPSMSVFGHEVPKHQRFTPTCVL